MDRILIIAAHPDDEVLGCGATALKLMRSGAEVMVLFIGEGSTCRFEDIESRNALRAISERNEAAVRALLLLGIKKYRFVNFPCGRFDQIPIIEINKVIESVVQDFKPNILFTHSDLDSNNDHRICHRATIMATRPCGAHIVNQVFAYEVLSSSEWCYSETFKPNYFVPTTLADLEKKWEALQCYGSEMRVYPFPRSYDGMMAQARQRGMQCGRDFAEAFNLVRGFDC